MPCSGGPGRVAGESALVEVRPSSLGPRILEVLGGHSGGPREVGYGTLGYRAIPVLSRTAVLGTGVHTVMLGRSPEGRALGDSDCGLVSVEGPVRVERRLVK